MGLAAWGLLDVGQPTSRFPLSIERPSTMDILLTALFLQPFVLATLYLYASGVFTHHRRAFRCTLYSIVLAFFALSILIQLSYPGYDFLAATAVLLIEVLPHS
jgi:hypothetical protein